MLSHHSIIADEAPAFADAHAAWIDEVARAASRFRIVSTLPYGKIRFWNQVVETLPVRAHPLTRLTRRFGIPDPGLIRRLLMVAPRADLVLLAGGERADLIYLALAACCPWIDTPHVIVDAHWQKNRGPGGLAQRLLLAAGSRLVREVQPHSAEEVEIYARAFGIRRDVLRPVPWSTSLTGYDITRDSSDGPFILSGGTSFRDYRPLIAACGALGLTLRLGIAASSVGPELRDLVAGQPTVTINTDWDNRAFLQQQADCSIFALPIVPGLTRATGDQSILNAMWFGRIVVASSSIGPRIYIRDGINGFLVPAHDTAAWTRVLEHVRSLPPETVARISAQAMQDAREVFNEPIRLARTLDNALCHVQSGRRPSWAVPDVGVPAA